MNLPRILYVSPNAFRGGAEKFVLDNLKLHQNTGRFEGQVLFFSDGPIAEDLRELGIKVHILPFKLKMRRPLTVLRTILYLFLLLRREKISLLHSTMSYAHIISSPAALFAAVPEIWFQHGPVGNIWDYIGKLLPFRKVLFNSEFLKREHNKLFGPNFEEDSLILPLGVEVSSGTDLELINFGIKDNKKVLLWIGRICVGKGLHLAVEALAQLKERDDWHLLVVGDANSDDDKQYLEKIKRRIKDLNFTDRISLVHGQRNMSRFYNISQMLIHSAIIPESFGLVVAEALGHGLFVAASSRGGVIDLIGKNERGILYDSFSKSASLTLAGIIDEYLEGRTFEIEKMRKDGTYYIKKFHSPERMNNSLEELYLRVLN